jgi:hypothetical protein
MFHMKGKPISITSACFTVVPNNNSRAMLPLTLEAQTIESAFGLKTRLSRMSTDVNHFYVLNSHPEQQQKPNCGCLLKLHTTIENIPPAQRTAVQCFVFLKVDSSTQPGRGPLVHHLDFILPFIVILRTECD